MRKIQNDSDRVDVLNHLKGLINTCLFVNGSMLVDASEGVRRSVKWENFSILENSLLNILTDIDDFLQEEKEEEYQKPLT
jgi:hypothetical protein